MPSTQLTASQLINENVFEWSVALIVLNEDSLYYGGYFKAKMTFPRNYPHSPPGTSQHMSGVESWTMTPRWREDDVS
jgi:ubiquitin-protein ligase